MDASEIFSNAQSNFCNLDVDESIAAGSPGDDAEFNDLMSQHRKEMRTIHPRDYHDTKVQYITTSSDLEGNQNRRFSMRSVCNRTVLVYIFVPNWHSRRLARVSLHARFHEANPSSRLERRALFAECRWSNHTSHQDIPGQLEDFIRDHMLLCDWAEAKVEEMKASGGSSNVSGALSGPPLDDLDIFLPTMRAVTMLFWPSPKGSNELSGRIALVLTGDDSRLRSGPIDFDSLREHQLPGYSGGKDIVHVSLEQAVGFLVDLDKREAAANPVLSIRNHQAAKMAEQEVAD